MGVIRPVAADRATLAKPSALRAMWREHVAARPARQARGASHRVVVEGAHRAQQQVGLGAQVRQHGVVSEGRHGRETTPSGRCRWCHLAWSGPVRQRPDCLRPCGSEPIVADSLIVRGAREHNLKDVSLDLPRDAMIVFTGLSGSGKSSPGLRHDLRRGPAPLRRVAVGVRPPVPRPDGQARRRLHRGPVAGRLDRPEVHLAQPPLDGRHDHRGLRLPAAALRPGRAAALPGLRRGGHPADAAADRRPAARAAGRHALPGARAVVRARKGEYADLFRELQTKGFSRARVDGEVVGLAEPPTLEKKLKHSIDVVVDRLVVQGVGQAPAHRLGRDGPRPGRRDPRGRARRRRPEGPRPRAALLREAGLPQRPPAGHGRARAALVLVQLPRSAPARSAPGWAPGSRSTPSCSSRTTS